MERGVQQRGVHAKRLRLLQRLWRGQLNLGKELLATAPCRTQALKDWPVFKTMLGQRVIYAVEIDHAGVSGRPGAILEQRRPLRDLRGPTVAPCARRHQRTAGVTCPALLLGGWVFALQTGVNAERSLLRPLGLLDHQLQHDRAVAGEHQRSLQRQLPHRATPDALAGAKRQLKKRGAREQRRAGDRVVGEPGVGFERDTPS